MCGIWGFKELTGKSNPSTLRQIIKAADERGGHSYGMFGFDSVNEYLFKAKGRSDVDMLVDIIKHKKLNTVIGQARLATSGSREFKDCQPLTSNNFAVVHNGNIKEPQEVYNALNTITNADTQTYAARTHVDSEVILAMLEGFGVSNFIINFEALVQNPYAILYVDMLTGDLKCHSKMLPLVSRIVDGVQYYCSKEWNEQY